MQKKTIRLSILLILILLVGSLCIYRYSLRQTQLVSVVVPSVNQPTPSTELATGDILYSGSLSLSSGAIVSGESSGSLVPIVSSYCLFDICVDPNKPLINQADGTIIQANNPEFNAEWLVVRLNYESKYDPATIYAELIKVNLKKGTASRAINDGFSSEDSIVKNGSYYLKINEIGGCAGSSKKQTILDKNGKESHISQFVDTYPKQFTIGNIVYTFSGVSTSYGWISIYTPEDIVYTGTLSVGDDVGAKIYDSAIEQKFLAKNYILEFQEIPWVKLVYASAIVPSDRLISLGMDTTWTEKNIVKNELIDLETTKKILSYYNNGARWVTMKNSNNGYQDMLTESGVLDEQLPIFRLLPIDTRGNYLLYTTSGYDITQFAELCKPLVYVYSSIPENNTLSVTLPSGGYFSKLIPHFSYGNSWDFSTDPIGNIDIWGRQYDYLYYSAKVPNYQWNTDGWQVYGSDMIAFFQDKLPKTGMNQREMDDFIRFWESEFKKDARYFVSFKFDDAIDQYAQLSFAHQPDAMHRILLEAYPMQESTHNDYYLWPRIGNQFDTRLLRSFVRSGHRDVLEWWWVVFDYDKNTYTIR